MAVYDTYITSGGDNHQNYENNKKFMEEEMKIFMSEVKKFTHQYEINVKETMTTFYELLKSLNGN